jgi:hypothetical protein
MQGLLNRAIECFVTDMHGVAVWQAIGRKLHLDGAGLDAMLSPDPSLARRMVAVLARILSRADADVLEDIGTYVVSGPDMAALRRLLRFGGEDFLDFLYSLDDLRDRARLAVASLDLPGLELEEVGNDRFRLICYSGPPYRPDDSLAGFGHVMLGLLRAMADDYGALVMLDHREGPPGTEVIEITLIETAFAVGRDFELGRRAG